MSHSFCKLCTHKPTGLLWSCNGEGPGHHDTGTARRLHLQSQMNLCGFGDSVSRSGSSRVIFGNGKDKGRTILSSRSGNQDNAVHLRSSFKDSFGSQYIHLQHVLKRGSMGQTG